MGAIKGSNSTVPTYWYSIYHYYAFFIVMKCATKNLKKNVFEKSTEYLRLQNIQKLLISV